MSTVISVAAVQNRILPLPDLSHNNRSRFLVAYAREDDLSNPTSADPICLTIFACKIIGAGVELPDMNSESHEPTSQVAAACYSGITLKSFKIKF